VVRTQRVDLTSTITALQTAADGLPHPGLEAAARSHAAFLADLSGRSDLLARQLLLVLREPPPPARAGSGLGRRSRRPIGPVPGSGQLRRRAEHAHAALAAAGVNVEVLDRPAATAVLSAAANPGDPARPGGLSTATAVITGPDEHLGQERLSWFCD
jgi:hypothetical protein